MICDKIDLIAPPDFIDWAVYISGRDGICIRLLRGREPNWFWRKMQFLAFGFEWVKVNE